MRNFPSDWKSKILSFMKLYEDFEAEIDCWEIFWLVELKGKLLDIVQMTLELTSSSILPNIYQALILIAIIPITKCYVDLKRTSELTYSSCVFLPFSTSGLYLHYACRCNKKQLFLAYPYLQHSPELDLTDCIVLY